LSTALSERAAEIWAKEGVALIEVIWEAPEKVKVEFWFGGKAWLHPGDAIQGFMTSSGVLFNGILRRRYRN
jgi:hypothetical protein